MFYFECVGWGYATFFISSLERVGFKETPQRVDIYSLQVGNTMNQSLGDLEGKKLGDYLDREPEECYCVGHNSTARVRGSVCMD